MASFDLSDSREAAVGEGEVEHEIEIVEQHGRASARWKCSCGQGAGGKWSRSAEQALKAAERHIRRAAK